jgi:hypothetical protein
MVKRNHLILSFLVLLSLVLTGCSLVGKLTGEAVTVRVREADGAKMVWVTGG